MAQGLTDLSAALAGRLLDVARMLDRLDRLESGTGRWLAGQDEARLAEAAAEMTLRTLRVAADPINYAVLKYLAAQATAPIAALEEVSGLGRLALNERLSDLVQVGLAGRNIEADQAQSTAGGAALVGLIESISTATAGRLGEALQPVTR